MRKASSLQEKQPKLPTKALNECSVIKQVRVQRQQGTTYDGMEGSMLYYLCNLSQCYLAINFADHFIQKNRHKIHFGNRILVFKTKIYFKNKYTNRPLIALKIYASSKMHSGNFGMNRRKQATKFQESCPAKSV